MIDKIEKLNSIDWNFSDYVSTKYPYDLNSIPWYPATFVPPIPKFLIASLTKSGGVVLDPFGGSGTTIIEAIKQNRVPIYNDLNPFAHDIVKELIDSIKYAVAKSNYLNAKDELKRINKYSQNRNAINDFISSNSIHKDVYDWYHPDTLAEIINIFSLIENDCPPSAMAEIQSIRKLALISILKPACSQPGHFTYITDNCKPVQLKYKNATTLYLKKIEQICLAAEDFFIQYGLSNPEEDIVSLLNSSIIHNGDARDLGWLEDNTIDLVVTSPPYLCAQDYIKTMRLSNMFFPNNEAFLNVSKKEIGARCKRRGNAEVVVNEFYADMKVVFSGIKRVLKSNGYFCLIVGQGKARITSDYCIVSDLCHTIVSELGFEKLFHRERVIGSRIIRIGGVDKEDIIIFKKTMKK